jgi:hypothetical protein
MKKLFYVLVFTSISCFAQDSFRHYNLDIKRGKESQVLSNFNSFWNDMEFNSGGIALQRVMFRNDVTHRVLSWGDPSNWGTTNWNQKEWEIYRLQGISNRNSNSKDSAMGTVLSVNTNGDTESSRASNPYGKIFEYRIAQPEVFMKAYNEWINDKKVQKIMGDRRALLISFDAGGSGATHAFIFYGKNMNDLILAERDTRTLKATAKFFEERGKVEYGKIYFVETVSRFE